MKKILALFLFLLVKTIISDHLQLRNNQSSFYRCAKHKALNYFYDMFPINIFIQNLKNIKIAIKSKNKVKVRKLYLQNIDLLKRYSKHNTKEIINKNLVELPNKSKHFKDKVFDKVFFKILKKKRNTISSKIKKLKRNAEKIKPQLYGNKLALSIDKLLKSIKKFTMFITKSKNTINKLLKIPNSKNKTRSKIIRNSRKFLAIANAYSSKTRVLKVKIENIKNKKNTQNLIQKVRRIIQNQQNIIKAAIRKQNQRILRNTTKKKIIRKIKNIKAISRKISILSPKRNFNKIKRISNAVKYVRKHSSSLSWGLFRYFSNIFSKAIKTVSVITRGAMYLGRKLAMISLSAFKISTGFWLGKMIEIALKCI